MIKICCIKGYTIQPYSPKAGTGLSSHELNQPGTYQDVTDTTASSSCLKLYQRNTYQKFYLQIEGDVRFLSLDNHTMDTYHQTQH